MLLPSSRVNDGICDCCDGSDEWKEKVRCTNNCIELGRESLKELIANVERQEAGVAKLQDLIAQGRTMKVEKEKALIEANSKLEALEAVLKGLEDTKNAEEKLEKEEQDRQSPPAAPEAPAAPEPAAEAPAAEAAQENFPYPKEYQYKEEKKEEEEAAFPYPAEYAYKEEAKETKQEEDKHEDKHEEEPAEEEHETPTAPAAPEKYISPAAETARIAYRAKEPEVRTAREQRDKLQQELAYDFGSQNEYMSLLGSCFDAQVRQYTYEACPYGAAAQKEGGSSTSLGTWSGFEKKENGQLLMKFAGGAKCWQGPERSFLVDLECGVDTQLSRVDEPSKCVYTATLATPAACNVEQTKALRDQLNVLLEAQRA